MAVPSNNFDPQKVVNAILYGDEVVPANPAFQGLAARYPLPTQPITRWSEFRYRIRYAARCIRRAAHVLLRG